MNLFRALPLLTLLAAAPLASANLLTNGDFESDPYSGAVDLAAGTGSLTGWTVVGDAAGLGVGYNGNTSQEIDLSGFRDSAGLGISQAFATVSGATYELTLDVYGAQVDVSVDGTALGTGLSGSARTPYSFTFTATDSSSTLSLISSGGSVAQVDNVNVQAVPEPASLAAFGVGALGLLRRRRAAR